MMIKKEHLKRIFEGMLMGGANVLPGVSGGTIALITGIYVRLISAINSIPLKSPILFLKRDFQQLKYQIRSVDYDFLIPLIIGILIGTLLLARLMGYLLYTVPAITYSFFFGLILASLGVIFKYIGKIDFSNIIWGSLGFFSAYLLIGLPPLQVDPTLFVVFICGILVMIVMILPGISGAFILIFLQQYDFMLKALNNFEIHIILTFITGGVVGLFGFSKVLEYLLNRYYSAILSILFGLTLGALRVQGEKIIYIDPPLHHIFIPAIIGAILIILLEYRCILPETSHEGPL